MNHFWCTHNVWTLYLGTGQAMGRYSGFYVLFYQSEWANFPQKIGMLALLWQPRTWKFWTDYKVAKGISQFEAKMTLPQTHVGCIYHSGQQITWEIDHFWHPANEWALSLFQIVLEKQSRFIMPLREQIDQNTHINIAGHPVVIADMVTLHISYYTV